MFGPHLLTLEQAAARLAVPKSWLYGRIHAGTLPFKYVKVGHYVRFQESEIMRFVESGGTADGQKSVGGGRRSA